MNWSEEEIALLKILRSHGNTASQIARALGKGITRNAVMGRIHRMKKTERKSAKIEEPAKKGGANKRQKISPQGEVKTKSKVPKVRRTKGRSNAEPDVKTREATTIVEVQRKKTRAVSDAETSKGNSLFDSLTGKNGCKWPIGHPNEQEFHFCGQQRHRGLPYCEEHVKEAYQPIERRRSATTRNS